MKTKFFFLVIICIAVIIQTSILPAFFEYPLPQMVLVAVIAGTIIMGFSKILPWVIVSGIALDLFSYSRIGVTVILFILMSYFVSFFSKRFLVESKGWGMLVMFFFVVAGTFLHRAFVLFFNFAGSDLVAALLNYKIVLEALPSEIFYNTVLFFICFLVFKKMEKFTNSFAFKNRAI